MTNPRNATTTSRGRTYQWRDETFDSVTTIISGGVPKPALKAWGERVVAETAVKKKDVWAKMTPEEAVDFLKRSPFRETDKAATKGSDIHEWAEAHVLGQPIAEPRAEIAETCDQFKAFIADWSPTFEASEVTVYNREHGYAGTLDTIVVLDGFRYLMDFKTGKGVYGEVALQLAAYRHAEFMGLPDGTEEPMPKVDGCAVLHLRPKGYQVIPVAAGQAEFRAFLYAQQVRRFCARGGLGDQALGQPLKPGQGDPFSGLPDSSAPAPVIDQQQYRLEGVPTS